MENNNRVNLYMGIVGFVVALLDLYMGLYFWAGVMTFVGALNLTRYINN